MSQIRRGLGQLIQRTFRKKFLIPSVARVVSFVFIFTNIAFAHSPQTTIWKERKAGYQVASLPMGTSALNTPFRGNLSAIQNELLKQTPAIRSAFRSDVVRTSFAKEKMRSRIVSRLPDTFFSHVNVKDVRQTDSANTVVILEDVHQNEEAQSHISEAIKSFETATSPILVGLEGAHGPFLFHVFQNFSRPDVLTMVADSYLKSSEISGPSHAGYVLAAGKIKHIRFWGIDDPSSYRANVAAYKSSSKEKNIAIKKIESLREKTEERKPQVLNENLKRFDDTVEAYRKNQINLREYVNLLSKYDEPTTLEFELFHQALEMEKKLDFSAVEKERRTVIEKLVRTLKENELNLLIDMSLAYQQGTLSFGDYYQRLRKICQNANIDLAQTPHFDRYVQYVLLADGVEADKLFKELTSLENRIYARFTQNKSEADLIKTSRQIYLMNELVNFSLTPDQWEEYTKAAHGLWSMDYSLNLSSYETFYRSADIRSEAMIKNTLRHADKTKSALSILVTGGFHTSELTSVLKEQNVSYIVAAPKITKVDSVSGSLYLSVFDQEKTPLEQIFSGQKLYLAPAPSGAASSLMRNTPDATGPLAYTAAAVSAAAGTAQAGDIKTLHRVGVAATGMTVSVDGSVTRVETMVGNKRLSADVSLNDQSKPRTRIFWKLAEARVLLNGVRVATYRARLAAQFSSFRKGPWMRVASVAISLMMTGTMVWLFSAFVPAQEGISLASSGPLAAGIVVAVVVERIKLVVANWKQNKRTRAEVAEFFNELHTLRVHSPDRELVIAPAFTHLEAVRNGVNGPNGLKIELGAQDVAGNLKDFSGITAMTGEVTADMLKDAGVKYVIIGHSERRLQFGDTNEVINSKIKEALQAGLIPILCVGETLAQYDARSTGRVLEDQLKGSLVGINAGDIEKIVVAYEPVWAIGTGKTPTLEEIEATHQIVRFHLGELPGKPNGEKIRILYGGSVKPGNVDSIMAQEDVDGVLVGGASLQAASFKRIVEFNAPLRPIEAVSKALELVRSLKPVVGQILFVDNIPEAPAGVSQYSQGDLRWSNQEQSFSWRTDGRIFISNKYVNWLATLNHAPPQTGAFRGENPVVRNLVLSILGAHYQFQNWNRHPTPVTEADLQKWKKDFESRYIKMGEDTPISDLLNQYVKDPAFKTHTTTSVKALQQAGAILGMTEDQIRQLVQPDWIYRFELPVKMDDGSTRIFVAWRIHHNDVLGPNKGGIRYAPAVDYFMVEDLAREMTIKTGVVDIGLGGAKGGIRVDPRQLSKAELARLTRVYSKALSEQAAIGEEIDIPAPDMNTTAEIMAWFEDTYIAHRTGDALYVQPEGQVEDPTAVPYLEALLNQGSSQQKKLLGMVTGKPVNRGGIVGREEATGRGIYFVTLEAAKKYLGVKDLKGVKVAIQGFGNVGYFTAKIFYDAGATVVSVSEARPEGQSAVVNQNGINIDELKKYFDANGSKFDGYKGEGATVVTSADAGATPLYADAQIVIPAAREEQITSANVGRVHQNVKIIMEAANGPTTPEADVELNKRGIVVVPDVLTNAGGVTVSGFEWLRNLGKLPHDITLEGVREKLHGVMKKAFDRVVQISEEKKIPLRQAAYVSTLQLIGQLERSAGSGTSSVDAKVKAKSQDGALGQTVIQAAAASLFFLGYSNSHSLWMLGLTILFTITTLVYILQANIIFFAMRSTRMSSFLVTEALYLRQYHAGERDTTVATELNGKIAVRKGVFEKLPRWFQRWVLLHERMHVAHPKVPEFLITLTDIVTLVPALMGSTTPEDWKNIDANLSHFEAVIGQFVADRRNLENREALIDAIRRSFLMNFDDSLTTPQKERLAGIKARLQALALSIDMDPLFQSRLMSSWTQDDASRSTKYSEKSASNALKQVLVHGPLFFISVFLLGTDAISPWAGWVGTILFGFSSILFLMQSQMILSAVGLAGVASKGLIPQLVHFEQYEDNHSRDDVAFTVNGVIKIRAGGLENLPHWFQRWVAWHESVHAKYPNWPEFLVAATDVVSFFFAISGRFPSGAFKPNPKSDLSGTARLIHFYSEWVLKAEVDFWEGRRPYFGPSDDILLELNRTVLSSDEEVQIVALIARQFTIQKEVSVGGSTLEELTLQMRMNMRLYEHARDPQLANDYLKSAMLFMGRILIMERMGAVAAQDMAKVVSIRREMHQFVKQNDAFSHLLVTAQSSLRLTHFDVLSPRDSVIRTLLGFAKGHDTTRLNALLILVGLGWLSWQFIFSPATSISASGVQLASIGGLGSVVLIGAVMGFGDGGTGSGHGSNGGTPPSDDLPEPTVRLDTANADQVMSGLAGERFSSGLMDNVLGSLHSQLEAPVSYQQQVEDLRAWRASGDLSNPEVRKMVADTKAAAEKVLGMYGDGGPSAEITDVVIIGIGGSDLGARALHEALRNGEYYNQRKDRKGPRIHFAGDGFNASDIENLDQTVDWSKTLLIPISKSGSTPEPFATYEILKGRIKERLGDLYRRRVLAVTGPNDKSLLFKEHMDLLAHPVRINAPGSPMHGGWYTGGFIDLLPVPEGVGGRYSIFSPVGLIYAGIAGLDIDALLKGYHTGGQHAARLKPTDPRNVPYRLAAVTFRAEMDHNKNKLYFLVYAAMGMVARWFRQGYDESVGKNELASYSVIAARGSADNHSSFQRYLDGAKDGFFILTQVDEVANDVRLPGKLADALTYLANRFMHRDAQAAVRKGSAQALTDKNHPNVTLHMNTMNEYTLGEYMAYMMRYWEIMARLHEVNPFDQPAVEDYKNATRKELERTAPRPNDVSVDNNEGQASVVAKQGVAAEGSAATVSGRSDTMGQFGTKIVPEADRVVPSIVSQIRELIDDSAVNKHFQGKTKENLIKWLHPLYEEDHAWILEQLQTIKAGNDKSAAVIKELNNSFYANLLPGTAGIRGTRGRGPNRVNKFTVGKFTLGKARYLATDGFIARAQEFDPDFNPKKGAAAVIARDPRIGAEEIQMRAALLYLSIGKLKKVYVYRDPRSTPQLSHAVQFLNSTNPEIVDQIVTGDVITASHNPKEDTGFKPYDPDGSQVTGAQADALLQFNSQITEEDMANAVYDQYRLFGSIDDLRLAYQYAMAKGDVVLIGGQEDRKTDDAFIASQIPEGFLINDDGTFDRSAVALDNFVFYISPLNGVGRQAMELFLEKRGVSADQVVWLQDAPDGEFKEIEGGKPNPELPKAREYAMRKAIEDAKRHWNGEGKSPIVLWMDPDADRPALAVVRRSDDDKSTPRALNSMDDFVSFNGNQQLALLANYMVVQLRRLASLQKKMMKGKLDKDEIAKAESQAASIGRLMASNKGGVFGASTVVSGFLMKEILRQEGIEVFETLVGFKYIGKIIEHFVQDALRRGGLKKRQYLRMSKSQRAAYLIEYGSRWNILGGEESLGAVTGDSTHDKNAPTSLMWLIEAAGYWKKHGELLGDNLKHIYKAYGYMSEPYPMLEFAQTYTDQYGNTRTFSEAQANEIIGKAGSDGKLPENIETTILGRLRVRVKNGVESAITEIGGKRIAAILDYQSQEARDMDGHLLFSAISGHKGFFEGIAKGISTFVHSTGETLPKENFIKLVFEDGSEIIVRPSGTEPKIKIYILGRGDYEQKAAIDKWVLEEAQKWFKGFVLDIVRERFPGAFPPPINLISIDEAGNEEAKNSAQAVRQPLHSGASLALKQLLSERFDVFARRLAEKLNKKLQGKPTLDAKSGKINFVETAGFSYDPSGSYLQAIVRFDDGTWVFVRPSGSSNQIVTYSSDNNTESAQAAAALAQQLTAPLPHAGIDYTEEAAVAIRKMEENAVALAGMTMADLADAKKRAEAVDVYNAHVGGLFGYLKNQDVKNAKTEPREIPQDATKEGKIQTLKDSRDGKRVVIVSGGGRATRMKLPAIFDWLGIGGLVRGILEFFTTEEYKDADAKKIEANVEKDFKHWLEKAKAGRIEREGKYIAMHDLSFAQRQLLQLWYQTEKLANEIPDAGVTAEEAVKGVRYVVTVNSANREAIQNQLAALHFPGKIWVIEQPEVGVLTYPNADGGMSWDNSRVYPEGHGEPFIAMAQRVGHAYELNDSRTWTEISTTLVEALEKTGVEHFMFAQVNDLHLLSNMVSVERWETALSEMNEHGAEFVMEMVENSLKQKGGGTFPIDAQSNVVMRDTLAMKRPQLESVSIPSSLSRMFYFGRVASLKKLNWNSIPAYLNPRDNGMGREIYSGDVSSVLKSRTIQQKGLKIHTFKERVRADVALAEIAKQDSQAGFGDFTRRVVNAAAAIIVALGLFANQASAQTMEPVQEVVGSHTSIEGFTFFGIMVILYSIFSVFEKLMSKKISSGFTFAVLKSIFENTDVEPIIKDTDDLPEIFVKGFRLMFELAAVMSFPFYFASWLYPGPVGPTIVTLFPVLLLGFLVGVPAFLVVTKILVVTFTFSCEIIKRGTVKTLQFVWSFIRSFAELAVGFMFIPVMLGLTAGTATAQAPEEVASAVADGTSPLVMIGALSVLAALFVYLAYWIKKGTEEKKKEAEIKAQRIAWIKKFIESRTAPTSETVDSLTEALMATAPSGSYFDQIDKEKVKIAVAHGQATLNSRSAYVRNQAIAHIVAYLEEVRAGRAASLDDQLEQVSNRDRGVKSIVTVLNIGQIKDFVAQDIESLYQILTQAHEDNTNQFRRRVHDVVIVLHKAGLDEVQLRTIEGLVGKNPNTIVVDSTEISLVDGARSYNEVLTVAHQKDQYHGLHPNSLLAVKKLALGDFENSSFRTFDRVPGQFRADGGLRAVWTLLMNLGSLWAIMPVEDTLEMARLAGTQA